MRTIFTRTALGATLLAFTPTLAAAQQCTSDARSVVDAVYRQVLERAATGSENSQSAAQLSNGQLTVRELVENVVTSPEHRQRFGNNLNADAGRRASVTNLYKHILARGPDPGGLQSQVEALSRSDIDAISSSIVGSAEYSQRFGDDAVPGQNVRLCAVGRSSSQQRFRDTDRNGTERNEGGRRYPNARDEGDFNSNGPATWTMPAFRQMDRNRDNRITPDEWYYSRQDFSRADRNRDGVVTPDEFVANAIVDDDRDNRDNRDDRFENLDLNGNGRIDLNEWRWSRRSFERYDTDGDGVISRREFSAGGGAPAAQPVR